MANIYGTRRSETIDLRRGSGDGPDFVIGPSDGSGSDFIFALDGNDLIYAGGGDDVIKGGGGADTINGGSGEDTASYFDSDTSVIVSLATGRGFGGSANGDRLSSVENLIGSTHSDLLVGDDGRNQLDGLAGRDTLRGGGGIDQLNGGDGDDMLYGEVESDELKGGAGRDTLVGGAGGDHMTGGADADTFVFTSMTDFSEGFRHPLDVDILIAFEAGTDVIDLSAIDADLTRDGDQAFSAVSSFTGAAGQLMVVERDIRGLSFTAVVMDIDGDGVEDASFFIHTLSGPLPSATDIVL
jgi:Ca2+-binding RTX toxin-like protein